MDKITLYIDGREIAAERGQSVLEAALAADIYIPHLCTHPDLPVQGNCGLCAVRIRGLEGCVCACETPAEDGIFVITKDEELNHRRAVAMELMLAGHPHDCTACKAYLKCELQAMTQYLGAVHSRLRTIRRETNGINTKNPLIVREMERCIQCGRCVRACGELRGAGVLQYNKLNGETYIGTQADMPLGEAGCRFCGACVAVCPTGALQDAEGVFRDDLPREQALVPCQAECPAHIDIPAYLRAVREGRPGDAAGILREKVPFPLVLGYVCNHRCETGCKRGGLNAPLDIRELKRFAVENDGEQAWKEKYLTVKPPTGKKIAVIGGGPCGLTAAFYLNKQGHDVTVLERKPELGGPMTGGIPAYRLPLEGVRAEIQLILDSGVRAEVNREVTNAAELKRDYDAVLIAVGVSRGKRLLLPGAELPQVYTALDILADCRAEKDLGYLGKTVCVIGGGSVGFDTARSLVRRGIRVNLACLEQADAILADAEDQTEGAEEGVRLLPGLAFEAIEGTPERVTGLRVHRVLSSTYDKATGLVTETAVEGSRTVIPCDSVIFATGQHTGLCPEFGVAMDSRGYPVTDHFNTSVEGIFAAGDAVTGISFVIDAIAQGREAARVMDRYLGGNGDIDETLVERQRAPALGAAAADFAALPRTAAEKRSPEERLERGGVVCRGYTREQAVCEAGRCLQCDLRKDISQVKLWTEYAVK